MHTHTPTGKNISDTQQNNMQQNTSHNISLRRIAVNNGQKDNINDMPHQSNIELPREDTVMVLNIVLQCNDSS